MANGENNGTDLNYDSPSWHLAELCCTTPYNDNFCSSTRTKPSTQKENKLYKKKTEKVNPNGKARFSSLQEDW